MEQLTLEQAAANHSHRACITHVELNRTAQEIDNIAFQAGAEWKKEQLKSKWDAMSTLMENGFAKDLVNRVAAQLLQD